MIDAFQQGYESIEGLRVFRAPGRVNRIGLSCASTDSRRAASADAWKNW